MKSKKLLDDVTMQELQEMRDQGMTNLEIANALDVNYYTVYRHLGKQPPEIKAPYGSCAKPKPKSKPIADPIPKHEEPVPPPPAKQETSTEEWKGGLSITDHRIQCDSSSAHYIINKLDKTVRIMGKSDGHIQTFTKSAFDGYVCELLEISEMLGNA